MTPSDEALGKGRWLVWLVSAIMDNADRARFLCCNLRRVWDQLLLVLSSWVSSTGCRSGAAAHPMWPDFRRGSQAATQGISRRKRGVVLQRLPWFGSRDKIKHAHRTSSKQYTLVYSSPLFSFIRFLDTNSSKLALCPPLHPAMLAYFLFRIVTWPRLSTIRSRPTQLEIIYR